MEKGARQILSEVVSQEGYARDALAVIAGISTSPTPSEALHSLYRARDSLGAEQAVFVSYMFGEEAHESYRFLVAADPRWCLEYQENAWFSADPWLLYASLNTETVPASRIPATTAGQARVLELAKRYGMASTCIAPAASSGLCARLGMLALGSSYPGFFEQPGFEVFKVLARALSIELHEWCARYERRTLVESMRITADDVELLKLELAGLGSKQIAEELGMSHTSINSRWQRLNRKLGSPHRHVTARLAAKYGLI